MHPNAQLFLSKVSYLPEKRQIVAEFANSSDRFSKRYSFFPKTHYPLTGVSGEAFKEILSVFDSRRFKADFNGGSASVFAATFGDLKEINNFLYSELGFFSNLVEPERQFLIERGWGYFDAFSLDGDGPVKNDSLDFPDVSMDCFSDPLPETMRDLLVSDRGLASELMEKIVYSRVLKLPLLDAEVSRAPAEVFLENIFFASSLPVSFGSRTEKSVSRKFSGKTELDFANVVPFIISRPFSNMSPETINCPCCAPSSHSDSNVLPSSLAEVVFQREGFYFNSLSPLWASRFHLESNSKDGRIGRKNEYNYSFFPAGPFTRNQAGRIPLGDALPLQEQGLVAISGVCSLDWFCQREEGNFSREMNVLKGLLASLDSRILEERSSVVASSGLFFSQSLDSRPGFYYRKVLRNCAGEICSSILPLLTDPGSRFFSEKMAVNVELISGGLLRDFERICLSSSCPNPSIIPPSRALVDSSSLMTVLNGFSRSYKLVKPLVLG